MTTSYGELGVSPVNICVAALTLRFWTVGCTPVSPIGAGPDNGVYVIYDCE